MTDVALASGALDGGFVPTPAPGVGAVGAGSEAVVVDERADRVHLLNSSAALLWSCFDGESSVAEICTDFAEVLGVPYDEMLADALGVVGDLVAEGVVYDGRGAPPPGRGAAAVDGAPEPDRPGRPGLLVDPPSS